MQGFQHDLWLYCPPLKSQEIFTSVVQYSLACFVRRYSKALPTYRRTKLFRYNGRRGNGGYERNRMGGGGAAGKERDGKASFTRPNFFCQISCVKCVSNVNL